MNTTGENCDMISDYWEDDWIHPIGYHVTTPCHQDDTAYRSFFHAFGLTSGPDGESVLQYQHDLFRDIDLANTHFGENGLCRATNLGFDMAHMNIMTYCTQHAIDQTEDYTVADANNPPVVPDNGWTPEVCAADSSHLPWPDYTIQTGRFDSALHSVGTVPNMPNPEATTYPATLDDAWQPGPWSEIVADPTRWGARCSDYPLQYCLTSDDCPENYQCRGRFCAGEIGKLCRSHDDCGSGLCQGVCASQTTQCLRHSECPSGLMCNGVGACVQPTLAVLNKVADANMSFQAYAKDQCGDGMREYSMLGGSHWSYVGQDLLRMHGMCSYGDWFRYTQLTKQCKVAEDNTTFTLDPAKCQFVDLYSSGVGNTTYWWDTQRPNPYIMGIRPTNCDRDYERLKGFKACAPNRGTTTNPSPTGTANVLRTDSKDANLGFDRFTRTYSEAVRTPNTRIKMAKMPLDSSLSLGFLGLGGLDTLDGTSFRPCSEVTQCYAGPFTVNGVQAPRRVRGSNATERVAYVDQDAFRCGIIGYQRQGRCQLDPDVLPLYRVLCDSSNPVFTSKCRAIIPEVDQLCAAISFAYDPSNEAIVANVDGLRALFYAFPVVTDLSSYFQLTDCMEVIHSDIQSRAAQFQTSPGLYYPMDFVLFEFPFAWFFQCMALHGSANEIDPNNPLNQDCKAYTERAQHPVGTGYKNLDFKGDSPMIYLRYVQGGYLRSWYEDYERGNQNATNQAVGQCLDSVRASVYGSKTRDFSYPRCSRNRRWTVGDFGGNTWAMTDDQVYKGPDYITDLRALIYSRQDTSVCNNQWQSDLEKALAQVYGTSLKDWISDPRFVIPDPDPGNIVDQPGMGGTTLLNLVEDYAKSQLGTRLVDLYLGLGAQTPNTAGLVTSINGVLVFDSEIPESYNRDEVNLQEHIIELTPLAQGDLGVEVYTDDPGVNHTCVFLPVDDPMIQQIYSQDAGNCQPDVVPTFRRHDKVIKCKGTTCVLVPTIYKQGWYYGCGYRPSAVDTDCNENSPPSCVYTQLDGIYQLFRRCYESRPPLIQPLAARPLPWLPGPAWGKPFNFVLKEVLSYQANIQPDRSKPLMCTIDRTAGQAINYTQCNSQHYKVLKKHIEQNYIYDGAVLIPSSTQLEWSVDRDFLNRGVILAFTHADRPINRTFMQGLFDDDTVCTGVVQGNERICFTDKNSNTQPVNPWLLGYWNPFSKCDVDFTPQNQGGDEYINAQCLAKECWYNRSINGGKDLYGDSMPNSKQCYAAYKQIVSTRGVPTTGFTSSGAVSYLPYNLCQHFLLDDPYMCTQDLGLLGGFDGLPVGATDDSTNMAKQYFDTHPDWAGYTYKVAPNMYTESTWDIPSDFQGGLFAGTNPIWQGDQAPYGFIRVPDSEIGIHRIGLVIARDADSKFSNFTIQRLPLYESDYATPLETSNSKPVQDWVPGLLNQILQDSTANRAAESLQLPPEATDASCPLRRFAYYSSNNRLFAPIVPSPKRARHVFGNITNDRDAHPTMTQDTTGRYMGPYKTTNGFCYCPVIPNVPQDDCLVQMANTGDTCSLYQTVQALRGNQLESRVFTPLNAKQGAQVCSMQLDWPNVDLNLRDGSSYQGIWDGASDRDSKKCHVLDRLKPFRYRYKPSAPIKQSGKTTEANGVCQSGRVATLSPQMQARAGQARCMRSGMNATNMDFKCTDAGDTPTLGRRQRLTPSETWQRFHQSRRKCNACSPPPRFTTQSGAPMPPESSFGTPFRVSAERMLAKDLRDALCNTSQGCPRFNRTAWRRGEFLHNYLKTPHKLFELPAPPQPTPSTPVSGDDSVLWAQPWAFCPNTKTLKTSEGCLGSISRAKWLEDRVGVCHDVLSALGTKDGQDPMAVTPFCNIHNTTTNLCQAVNEAKILVTKANCIASGKDPSCLPQPFVYHPGSFDSTNQEWVHNTVRDFYTMYNPAACPSPSAKQQEVDTLARKFQVSCPANSVNLYVGILRIIRKIVAKLAMILSTVMGMIARFAAMLVQGPLVDFESYKSELYRDWTWLKREISTALGSIGDMIIDMLLNSGQFGAMLMSMIYTTCDMFQDVYVFFMNNWCKYIQTHMPKLLGGLRKAIGMTRGGFELLNDFMDLILQGVMPASFVMKYGGNFQDLLTLAYSEPTKKDGDHVSNTRPTQELRPISKTAQIKKAIGKGIDMAGNFLGNKYVQGLLLGAGIYLAVDEAVQNAQLSKLYPANWTLFDFQAIVDTIDNIERWIRSQERSQRCVAWEATRLINPDFTPLNCQRFSLKTSFYTRSSKVSIDATQCWASIQPNLGQSSLFACTAASTCCADLACTPCDPTESVCTSMIPCYSCPAGTQGTTQFACDSIQKKCRCNVAVQEVTACSSNANCGSSSQCALEPALGSAKYGSTPCRTCPTSNVMCMLDSGSLPGQCTCLLEQNAPLDICAARAGVITKVDATKLCGYLPPPFNAMSSQRASGVYDNMVMVPCYLVEQAICATVYMPSGQAILMSVALSTFSSRRRRLLSLATDVQDDLAIAMRPIIYTYESEYELFNETGREQLLRSPGWNATAEPCAGLVLSHLAGNYLGPMEKHELGRCVYWRHVGRRIISFFNLTALASHDTFLLSMDDFAGALGDPDVVGELILQ